MCLGERCVLIFCPFLIVWSVLLLSFKSCLDILDAGLLSVKWFVEIFSQSVACFQSLNPVFHRESCHFNDVSLLIFFFLSSILLLLCWIKKLITKLKVTKKTSRSPRFSPVFFFPPSILFKLKYGVTGKFGLGIQNEAGQSLIEFCQENALVIANILFQQHKRRLYTWTSPMVNTEIRLITFFAAKDGEALYSQQKQDRELTVAQIMNSLLPNSDLNWRN